MAPGGEKLTAVPTELSNHPEIYQPDMAKVAEYQQMMAEKRAEAEKKEPGLLEKAREKLKNIMQ